MNLVSVLEKLSEAEIFLEEIISKTDEKIDHLEAEIKVLQDQLDTLKHARESMHDIDMGISHAQRKVRNLHG